MSRLRSHPAGRLPELAPGSIIRMNVSQPIAQTRRADLPVLFVLSATHLLNDMIQSLIPAIYPIIKTAYTLDFGQIGLITLTFQITASLLQPVVGAYAAATRTVNGKDTANVAKRSRSGSAAFHTRRQASTTRPPHARPIATARSRRQREKIDLRPMAKGKHIVVAAAEITTQFNKARRSTGSGTRLSCRTQNVSTTSRVAANQAAADRNGRAFNPAVMERPAAAVAAMARRQIARTLRASNAGR